ncbi:MAG: SCO family protein [Candidatus Latescibacterota bacterium]|nr:SCO family protein [Candidatus Latescibacterota bacterium]
MEITKDLLGPLIRRWGCISRRVLIATVVFCATGCVSPWGDGIVVRDAWIRELPPSAESTAAYMVIENRSLQARRLTRVTCDIAGRVEFHESLLEREVMSMRWVEAISVPAEQRVTLNPGGLHLMFIDLIRLPRAGEQLELQLHLDSGETVETVAVVRSDAAVGSSTPSLRAYHGIGGDFVLDDQHGDPFQLTRQRSDATLLFFGYTFCPDVCPVTLSKISVVRHELGLSSDRLATVFITVDPERDSPQVLREYLAVFDSTAIGLSGSSDSIDRVVEMYGGEYELGSDGSGGYAVSHSTTTYLLDEDQVVRYLFRYDESPAAMAEVIQSLLEEQRDGIPAPPDTSMFVYGIDNPCTCGDCDSHDLVLDHPLWSRLVSANPRSTGNGEMPQLAFPFGLESGR